MLCRFDICFLHGHQIGFTPLPSLIRNPNLSGVPLAARYTTCLWGAHFSNNEQYTVLKPWFLRRAIEELPDLLRQAQASRNAPVIVDGEDPLDAPLPICQAIQVSTVLATYLYAHDRPLEGAYHASTATRLVLASGLHHSQLFPSTSTSTFSTRGSGEGQTHPYYSYPTIATPAYSNIPPSPVAPSSDLLAPPKTESEALRRLYVFWNCYIVDRSWNVVCPVPVFPWVISSSFCRGDGRSAITAPWPEDWGLFGVCSSADIPSDCTLIRSCIAGGAVACDADSIGETIVGRTTKRGDTIRKLHSGRGLWHPVSVGIKSEKHCAI